MPKLKNYGRGKRFNVWIPEKHLKMWLQFDNRSKFVQLALDQAVGVMAWAILKERQGYQDPEKFEDLIGPFNEKFPVDPLTKSRQDIERTKLRQPDPSPQPHTELW